METLSIQATTITPYVHFDPTGFLEISGISVPEDSYEFYKPLLDWLEAYRLQPAPHTQLVFRFEYFNTSSTSYILKFIKALAQLKKDGHGADVKWYHDFEDDDMSEAGKGLGMLTSIPVDLVGYKKEEA